MPPLVSILVPAYNSASWIDETLRSAVNQSWQNKEIIVVNDGSTDKTLEIVHAYTKRGVRVVTQANKGAAAARNQALLLAKGDYIQWLDADDLLSTDKIARQMEAATKSENKRVLFSSGWGYFMHRQTKAKFNPTSLWCDLAPLEWMCRKWEGNLHMQTATWLVSRELTATAGPWNESLLGDDDGEYFSRVVKASDSIAFVPGSKVYYRITGTARLSYIGRSKKKIEAQFLGMRLQINYLLSMRDTPRIRAACVSYLQNWLIHFHPEHPDIVKEARELAVKLGGQLTLPHLSWKYAWIKVLFGWSMAKRAQLIYNRNKTILLRSMDGMMARLESPATRVDCKYKSHVE